jgi:V8-like Glu-specific endopeptidase
MELVGSQPVESDSRVVAYFDHGNGTSGCSGFLFSPQIVFTAAHCTLVPEAFTQIPVEMGAVGLPGAAEGLNSKRIKVVKIFRAAYQPFRTGPPLQLIKNDFAILVLDKPLATVPEAPLVSAQLLAQAITGKSVIKDYGYGYQGVSGEQSPNYRGTPVDRLPRYSVFTLQNPTTNSVQEIQVEVKYPQSICGGDSGGPMILTDLGIDYYIGLNSNGDHMELCGQGNNDYSKDGYMSSDAVYNFNQLIEQAKDYVLTPHSEVIPVAVNKIKTISCVSGKKTLKVSSVNPTCPKGFKKK